MDEYLSNLQAYHYEIIIKGIKKEVSNACSFHFSLLRIHGSQNEKKWLEVLTTSACDYRKLLQKMQKV
jgi:hypothetical protein